MNVTLSEMPFVADTLSLACVPGVGKGGGTKRPIGKDGAEG
jgi:hypothetical protein